MSGLALTAFILSLLFGFAAAFAGLWWLAAITLVLGIWGVRRADPVRFRGRGFAITAVVLSALGGVLGYSTTRALRSEVGRITGVVCNTMSVEGVEDAKRIHRLNDWIHERVAGEGVAEKILVRFRQVEARMGPYQETLPPFSIYSGYFGVVAPPGDPGLHEVSDPLELVPPLTSGKAAFWGRARFEQGIVHVGLFLYGQNSGSLSFQSRLEPNSQRARLFSDIRFYVPSAGR